MFKFMKSKKGFSLVELMIVVVIMAILVAVAVPIFSAVTKNARTKTCNSNRREIVSQLTNLSMSAVGAVKTGTIYLQTNADADDAVLLTAAPTAALAADATDATGADTTITKDSFKANFQELPYCPVAGNYLTVTVADSGLSADGADSFKITVTCGSTATSNQEVHA